MCSPVKGEVTGSVRNQEIRDGSQIVGLVLVLEEDPQVVARRMEDSAVEVGWSPRCLTFGFQGVVVDRKR